MRDERKGKKTNKCPEIKVEEDLGERRGQVYGGIMRWMEKLAGRMDELEDR